VGLSIVYVVNTVYPFYDGGYERRFFELARRLAMRGCSVTVFTSAPKNTFLNGVRFINVCSGGGFFTSYGFRSIGREARFSLNLLGRLMGCGDVVEEADIVEVNQTPPFHIFPVKLLANSLVVMTVHEDLIDYLDDYWRIRLNRLSSLKLHRVASMFSKSLYLEALKCADHYVSPSRPTVKSLIRHGIDRRRISYIPNGIDVGLQEKYRSESLNDKVVVSFLGRLVPEKRPEWIIYALRRILKMNSKLSSCLEVNIIGSGPLAFFLERIVRDFGLDGVVKIRGYVSDDEKFRILSKSNIFCLPSRREGFSLALLEAMFFGAAPLVTVDPYRIGISGMLELVSHLRSGYVAYGFNGFVEGLYRLIIDEDLRTMIGRNAMEISRHYDWNNIAALAENVYRKILNLNL